ncbi:MAG: DUF6491 family protein [Pseudomonadota bacterium]
MIRKSDLGKHAVVRALALCVLASGISVGAANAGPRGDKAQETLAKYEKTGETQNCLSLRAVRDTDALDDYTLLVEAGGSIYLNELSGRCIGLEREQRYTRRSTQARMCRGDIIQVIDINGTPLGSCSLGDFEKLNEVPETEES